MFWVHASSGARFEESYKSIAQRIQLIGWNEPEADTLGMVHSWLSDENNGPWSMVVDNADNTRVLFEPWSGETDLERFTSASAGRSLADYLPSSIHGSILITTRSRKVAEGLIEYAEDILDIRPMDANEAVALLTKKLKNQGHGLVRPDLSDLAQELDYMPLAISQAAAYVNQRAPRVTVSKYLDELRRSDRDRAKLLQVDIRDPRRDGQASNSILTTWYVSFEYLRQTCGSAVRLLSLMSLFDREGIPDHLLRGWYLEEPYCENGHENQRVDNGNEINFEDDIATLRAYDLIGVGFSDRLFDMHRLVQFSTKKWLEIHDELPKWQERYVDVLNNAFPTGDHVNWPVCQALFPHIEAMAAYQIQNKEPRLVWASILYRGAWYTCDSGRYGLAKMMAQASLEVREVTLGWEHTQTLESMDILASVLQYQGKYEQAEEMDRRALTGSEKALGVDHPHTLTSVSNLALVLQDQGKYEQAEEMDRRALTGSEKALGVDHPHTLTSVSNLASVLQHQGKYEQAEEMDRRALAGNEKALGVDHPNTLTSVHCLTDLLNAKQDRHRALKLYQRAVDGYDKMLGLAHSTTQACQRRTASLLEEMNALWVPNAK